MKPWSHFRTITKHKMMVMKYCFRVGLYRQGLMHDLSKYSPAEFLVGAKYYQGTRSPNNAEREAIGVSTAWLHHKGRNKHHFEYWVDYSLDHKHVIMGARMPRLPVVPMARAMPLCITAISVPLPNCPVNIAPTTRNINEKLVPMPPGMWSASVTRLATGTIIFLAIMPKSQQSAM